MRGYLRVGISLLAFGTLLVALIPAAPAAAAPLVPRQAPVVQSAVVLGDTSIDAPALWTSNPSAPGLGLNSVLAWTGTNPGHSLNVMESSDGVTYGGKVTFSESSNTRPAVAIQGPPDTLVLAWTGTDAGHSLNLLCQGPACGTGGSSYRKLTFGDYSFASPALERFGNGFLLAWVGTDPRHSLNIRAFSLTPSGSGFQVGTKTTLGEFGSIATPSVSLNPRNNQLMLSWAAGSPTGLLEFATSGNGVNWSAAQTLPETSGAGPSGFAVGASSMPTYWMAWTGTDPAHSLNVQFTSSLSQWPASDKRTLGDTAFGGPVLGYAGDVGRMLLAWTGTDAAHHLNVATLTTSATPALDQRIDAYIAGLSTTQLIGQTLMMSVCTSGYNSNLNQALTQWDVGSAIVYTSCGDGTVPSTAAGLLALDRAMQGNAPVAHGSLLLGIDEEGGTVDRLAPYFGRAPSARTLGNSTPQDTYSWAQTHAGRMRSVGLNVDFAPVADVYQGGGEGADRMFGNTAGHVTTYAGAFLDGLQQHGVAGSLKHWPGLGAATGNPDFVLPTINQSQAQMRASDFAPFGNLLYEQPGMVMVTTVLAPAFDSRAPADLSATLVSGVLRGQLGYQGVVVTDALGAQGIVIYMRGQGYSDATQGIAEAAVRAFLAGDDLLLAPLPQNQLGAIVAAMTGAVQSGRISRARLLASVHRIIRLKIELGLMGVP